MGDSPLSELGFSGSFQGEFSSLQQERDPELYSEGLLALGRRLEAADQLQAAAEVYAQVGGQRSAAGNKARKNLDALIGRGAFGPRFEYLLNKFSQDATDYRNIVPMLAASVVSGLVRAGTFGRLLGSGTATSFTRGFGARALSGGLAWAAEVPTFALGSRALRRTGGSSDSSGRTLGEDLLSAGLTLGCLKLGGFAGETVLGRLQAGSAPSYFHTMISQASSLAGLLGAQGLERQVGLRPSVDGATEVTDALASLFSLGVGARLGSRLLGKRFALFQGEVAVRNRLLEDFGPIYFQFKDPGNRHGALALGAGLGLWTILHETSAEASVNHSIWSSSDPFMGLLASLGVGATAIFWFNVSGRNILSILKYLIRGPIENLGDKIGFGAKPPSSLPPKPPGTAFQPGKDGPTPMVLDIDAADTPGKSVSLFIPPPKPSAAADFGLLRAGWDPRLQSRPAGWVKEKRQSIVRTLNNRRVDLLIRSLASDNLVRDLRRSHFDAVGLLEATSLFWVLAFHPGLDRDSQTWVYDQYVDFLSKQQRFPYHSPQVYREAMRLRRIFSGEREELKKRFAAATAYSELLPKLDVNSTVGSGEALMAKVALEDFMAEGKVAKGTSYYDDLFSILEDIEAKLSRPRSKTSEF